MLIPPAESREGLEIMEKNLIITLFLIKYLGDDIATVLFG